MKTTLEVDDILFRIFITILIILFIVLGTIGL